jgi:S-formylglutathione hydrolase FrmB
MVTVSTKEPLANGQGNGNGRLRPIRSPNTIQQVISWLLFYFKVHFMTCSKIGWALAAVLFIAGQATAAGPLEFHLRFDKNVAPKPFTGRVYVMLSKQKLSTVPNGISWFGPEPCFAVDVKEWKPGQKIVLKENAISHPLPIAKLPKKKWSVVAVMDFDRGNHLFSRAAGNVHSKPVQLDLDPTTSGPVELVLDQVVKETPFKESSDVKLMEVESKLLTKFNGRPTKLRAGVVLPKSFHKDPSRKYPVVYEITGFGGDHRHAHYAAKRKATEVSGVEMLWVVLDANCRHGHHVFADSANNGPVGHALMEELIPALEKRFRAVGKPSARFLTGHSSGGWSSLWLQVTYPDQFNGVWSTAPDPVDFRDFQAIDLYRKEENMFKDATGRPRPIARVGKKPRLWYKDFSDMEEVMGHGGQLAAFEAVFSPRGADGKPKRLWDRKTGKLNQDVAKAWEKYDIRLVLERNWKKRGPKLTGKLHVYMGDEDTFYLEGATRLLQASLKKLGSDAKVELFPKRHHGNLIDAKLRKRMNEEMAARFKASNQES